MKPEFSLEAARARDAADPATARRSEFHFPRRPDGREVLYLCGNSLGLQPRRAAEDVAAFMDEWQRLGVLGYHDAGADWLNLHERLAPTAAALAGARPLETVVMNSLTINLHLLMASFYRPTRERHVILIEQGAFPSDRYAVASQIGWHGHDPHVSLVQVAPRAGEPLLRHEDIVAEIERLESRLALVLLPGVQYLTGQRLDIAALTAAAHRVGAVAGFDLAHAIGNLPLSLHEWDVDFAAWCSYKYLNGGPGATAGAFVHERHFDSKAPRLSGWWGNDIETRFEMAEPFRPTEVLPAGRSAITRCSAWSHCRRHTHSSRPSACRPCASDPLKLTGWLEELLEARLGGRIEILTPRDPEARGAQLSVRLCGARGHGRALFDRMLARGLTCDWREPDVIRLAPAPLYNSYEDCWRAVALIESELGLVEVRGP